MLKVITYKSAVSSFYGTEYEIWDGFGTIGSIENQYATFEVILFMFSWADIVAPELKSCPTENFYFKILI